MISSILRILVSIFGAMFVLSGLLHIANPFNFAANIAAYHILSERSTGFAAAILPSVQIVIGILIMGGARWSLVHMIAIGLFGVFAMAQGKVLISGEKISCGCLGYFSQTVSWWTFLIPCLGVVFCTSELLIFLRSDFQNRSQSQSDNHHHALHHAPEDNASIHRQGFTLVELLVVLGIISLLMLIFLPAIQAVRESARRVSCLNKLRMIGLAGINYESSSQKLPEPWFNENLQPDSIIRNRKSRLVRFQEVSGVQSGSLRPVAALPFPGV